MSARGEELERRRRELQARGELQRRELARSASMVEEQLASVDRGITVVRRLLTSPLFVVAAIAVVSLAGPARLIRWTSHALLLRSALKRVTRA